MNDVKLISKLQQGDSKHFKHLYKHYNLVERYVITNSGSVEDAKDIFQNTLLAFYKNIQKSNFTLSAKISTFLFSIAKNLWLQELRKRKVKKIDLDTIDKRIAEDDNDNDDELIERTSAAIKQLSKTCQDLIKLYYYHQKNWTEIMTIMKYKNEHSARNQKYKCFQQLKKRIS